MQTENHCPADYMRARTWVAQNGGDLFPTFGSLEWFIRQHREELIRSGEMIVRRGPGGILIGPNFGRVAVDILKREQVAVRGAA